MAGEDSAAAAQTVQAYAFDQYRRQGGGSLASLLTMGMSDVIAAARAIGAATEAQALSVDPHVVDAMLKKLTEMQDELAKIRQRASILTTATPLGGGYAEAVGAVNKQVGTQAAGEVIPDLVKAIDDLKAELKKSRSSYQNVDGGQSSTFKNL
ncbi:hypothetical protein [Umezawaea sp.]|uniref:hypothetical protein n=1 Tax=Umezawaea sp. TaxID=1955258 RepID=UPI002ED3107C